ncbi:MAG: IPT/TIG domain-containing protein [Bacteroidetes bacterium]|nr:IPT/TIG domain-containing protein [Bacteroidota bacterium]
MLLLSTFVSTQGLGQCMLLPVSLEDRVSGADAVIEARVIDARPFVHPANNIIHTAYELEVYRSFKGHTQTRAILVAEGGQLGDRWHVVDPGVQLTIGQTGIFTLRKDYDLLPQGTIPAYTAFAGPQGVITYTPDRSEASDAFTHYTNLREDLFARITKKTGKSYHVILGSAQSLIIEGENDHLVPPAPIRTLAAPGITSFSPGTVNAGTGAVLTITGTNFGTYNVSTSKVRFQNADLLPGNYIDALDLDIVSWTDTQIEVVVRSRAGTGQIQVSNADGTATSVASLTVNYNLTNLVQAGVPFRVHLAGPSSGGYLFRYNTDFEANAAAKASYERALQTWHCNTNFHLVMDATTTALTCQADEGTNIIAFEDIATCNRDCGVLGVSYSYYSGCLDGGGNFVWYLKGNDVIFKEDGTVGNGPCAITINWEYGPGMPSVGESDFESVAVHELGHTHQIGHVVNPALVMHRSLTTGTALRTVSVGSDVAAGLDIMALAATNEVAACGQPQHTPISPTGCSIPRINFASATLSAPEANANTDLGGCRSYRAYTVNMNISAAPTGDAVLSFSPAGSTAVSPADYALYDAANTAALTTLTFPDGGTSSQSFTLRVYDDQAVEGPETLLLNFSIGSGTDALKGLSADTALTVTIGDNDLLPSGGVNTVYSEDFEGGPFPSILPTNWTSLNFYGAATNQFSANTTPGDAISGNYSLLVSTNILTFTPPYAYDAAESTLKAARTPLIDGSSASDMKLAFDWKCVGNAGADFGLVAYSLAATPNTPVIFNNNLHSQATARRDTLNLPSALDGQSFYLWFGFGSDGLGTANMPLMADNIHVFEGTAAPTVQDALASVDTYLGPNSTVAVYDAGKILCVIENTSAHDYGCTTVAIDRAGAGAVAFQKTDASTFATEKTLLITPANNNPTGSYNLRVYYSEAEVAGWETATGNDRADLTLFKSKAAISNVNPAAPNPPTNPGGENTYGTSPIAATYAGGIGYSVQASFATGFSGFGGGLPDPDGPIGLAPLSHDLNLRLSAFDTQQDGILLRWTDNDPGHTVAYQLERTDASGNLAAQAKVQATGATTYEYLDTQTLTGRTSWRVKRLNPDGVASYSNLVSMVQDQSVFRWELNPNPALNTVQMLLKHTGTAHLQVVDALGKPVLEETYTVEGSSSIPLSLTQWPAGLYHFTLQVNGVQHSRKLVVLPH